jgi:periplasmic divalent cation tolerance protein
VVLCTFPDQEKARQIGTVLVERQLAACINILPGVESIYRWKGELNRDAEALALIKTTAGGYPALEEALVGLHPYDEPEVIALEVVAGSAGYLGWVGEMVG